MDEASTIALLTGFGGVLIGGGITFFSEMFWRSRERQRENRKHFQIVMVGVMDAYEDLQNNMRMMTSSIVEPDGVICSQIRQLANHLPQPVYLEPETMFSAADKDDENLFSETSLFLKRHRSTLGALTSFYLEKSLFTQLVSEKKKVVNVSDGDVAENNDLMTIEFTSEDKDLVLQFNKTEMLAKDVLRMLRDNIIFGRDIVKRLNESSKRKFRKKPPNVIFTTENLIPGWMDDWT